MCLNVADGSISMDPTKDPQYFRGGHSCTQQPSGSCQYSFKGQRGGCIDNIPTDSSETNGTENTCSRTPKN